MAGSQRLKRMADTVQRELSELIRQELKDPRLGSGDHLSREGEPRLRICRSLCHSNGA